MYSFRKKRHSLIREIIETTILAGLVFVCLQLTVQNYQVEGSSMVPTLDAGDCLVTNKLVYTHINPASFPNWGKDQSYSQGKAIFPFHSPKHGEIVVFEYPNDRRRHFVKRVIAVPGDEVKIERGQVYVDQVPIVEEYLDSSISSSDYKPRTLKADEYFVLGDNRRSSNDSRAWGTINSKHIIGKYWFRYRSILCDLAPFKSNNLK